jgi:hypothetical protein
MRPDPQQGHRERTGDFRELRNVCNTLRKF